MKQCTIEKRLSDTTHELAIRGLDGEWGRALVDMQLHLESVPGYEAMSAEMQYAQCVRLIAENAPLRVTPGEKLVGAATLAGAARHINPVYRDGDFAFPSTSHLTCGFDWVMKVGYRSLRKRVEQQLARERLDAKGMDMMQAMLVCLDAAETWHRRYIDSLGERIAETTGEEEEAYRQLQQNLARVPEDPPANFREALQSLWFMFCFQRLVGNWPGIGRIDEMLGPFLQQDLANGFISRDEARELIAHFWIKGCEWIGAQNPFGGTGDAQFYQNIILGGVNTDGEEITNEVTYLVLDVIEELGISDYPVAVRLRPDSPERLIRRVAELQQHSGGIVAVYNEDTVIKALTRFGYPLREARRFTNDGCWEPQIPGETNFIYVPIDLLGVLQGTLGVVGDGEAANFSDFASLREAFTRHLAKHVEHFHAYADTFAQGGPPATVVSLLTKGCIETGRGYHDRGAHYTVIAPHAGGVADTGNSLYAIKKLVYEQHLMSLREFVQCLRGDWKDHEDLRQRAVNELRYYGDGCPEADMMTASVLNSFLALVEEIHERNGVLRPAGVSTFGREIAWRDHRGATAFGSHEGEILATNLSPSPGTDRSGPTSVISSYCSLDLTRLPSGTALEVKLLPQSVQGEEGVQAIEGLIRGFLDLGGFYMQVDSISNDTLRDAQVHPEKYPHLSVRISGWSARFVTLSKEWQEMIINRTQQTAG